MGHAEVSRLNHYEITPGQSKSFWTLGNQKKNACLDETYGSSSIMDVPICSHDLRKMSAL